MDLAKDEYCMKWSDIFCRSYSLHSQSKALVPKACVEELGNSIEVNTPLICHSILNKVFYVISSSRSIDRILLSLPILIKGSSFGSSGMNYRMWLVYLLD